MALRAGEVQYARVGDGHVAYRELESAASASAEPVELVVLLAGTMPMEALFDDHIARRFLEGLVDLGRVVLFDRRGIGMSDPPPMQDGSGLLRWLEDVEAVVGATGVRRPVLVSTGLSASVAVLYCDRHAADVTSAVLFEPSYGVGLRPDIVQDQIIGSIDSASWFCPSRADEPGFREWFNRAGRMGASPQRAVQAYPRTDEDLRLVEDAGPRVQTPVLVMRRPAHRFSPPAHDDTIVAMLPGAVRVDLPGEDLWVLGNEIDPLLAELSRFITGEHRLPAPERVLSAILFTDLVASTDRATELGDARWKRLLDRHDELARACVGRRGGTVIKHMGDGLLAMLPSAANAFRAARELRSAMNAEGLELYAGIHVADVDMRADDLSGIGVHIAARILALAAPNEILASSTAMQVATGDAFEFEPRGDHVLKGVPGRWPVFLLT